MATKICRLTHGNFSRLLPSVAYARNYYHTVTEEQYLYHPMVRPLEPEVQTLSLTKTLNMGDISNCLHDTSIDPVARDEMMGKFRQNILQTRLFNFDGDFATRDMAAMPLMQNMLRVVWSYAKSFPGLLETSLTYKPHISAHWEREHTILVSGHLGFLLSSKHPLKQVADNDEIEKSKEIQVEKPEIISPIFHFPLTRITPKFDSGFHGATPFPYPHTFIIVSEDTKCSTGQLIGQGIMFVCARLAAEAIQSHQYQLGDDLEMPLTSQCIITDGIRLSFINYQLNTLCFHGDEGIKNMAWISPGVFMYKKAMFDDLERPVAEKTVKERKRFRRPVTIKDLAKHEIVLEEFNGECFETFVKMIVNGCKPS